MGDLDLVRYEAPEVPADWEFDKSVDVVQAQPWEVSE